MLVAKSIIPVVGLIDNPVVDEKVPAVPVRVGVAEPLFEQYGEAP